MRLCFGKSSAHEKEITDLSIYISISAEENTHRV